MLADVTSAVATVLARAPHRLPRDGLLGMIAAGRQLLDGFAVAVAGLEAHPGIDAGRIVAQDPLRLADALEERLPIRGLDRAQAADTARNDRLDRCVRRNRAARPIDLVGSAGEPLEQNDP
jgi:hypothetical protein